MSIKAEAIWAPSPSTTRGQPTQLSSDPKGERIAYASNKSVFLRSIDNPSQSTQYTGHTTATTVARFSPSGYYCASGDTSGTVRVWDSSPTGEGSTKGEYSIISGRINDLAWDGDSQRIIAVGDGKQRLGHCITADSGNTVGEISGHTSQINCVSVRQQRPLRAATGSDDASVVFYHGAPFKFNTSLREHKRYVYGLGFSPHGDHLVSVGADRKIWLYDGKTGEVKMELPGEKEHTGSVFGVSWAGDSKRFATCSADQTVKLWDPEAGKCVHSWKMGEEGSVSVPDHQVGIVWPAARSDGLIISLNLAGDLNYLSERSPKPQRVVQGHQKNITTLAEDTSKGSTPTFLTGDAVGRVCSWDPTKGEGETIDGQGHTNYVSALSTSSSGRIYSVGWDDTLRSIDVSANTFTGASSKTNGQPRGVATISKGTVVITHKGISLRSSKDDSIIKEVPTPWAPTVLAASEHHIAVAGDDNAQHTYTTDLEPVKTIPQSSAISAFAFSTAAHRYLAVGFANGKILVYEPDNAEPVITRWSAHTGRVTSICWDAKGERAVTGGLDANIFVYSVAKPGQRVSVGSAHKDGVNGVKWLPGSGGGGGGGEVEDRVLSVGGDAAVKVWRVAGVV